MELEDVVEVTPPVVCLEVEVRNCVGPATVYNEFELLS